MASFWSYPTYLFVHARLKSCCSIASFPLIYLPSLSRDCSFSFQFHFYLLLLLLLLFITSIRLLLWLWLWLWLFLFLFLLYIYIYIYFLASGSLIDLTGGHLLPAASARQGEWHGEMEISVSFSLLLSVSPFPSANGKCPCCFLILCRLGRFSPSTGRNVSHRFLCVSLSSCWVCCSLFVSPVLSSHVSESPLAPSVWISWSPSSRHTHTQTHTCTHTRTHTHTHTGTTPVPHYQLSRHCWRASPAAC